MIIKRGSEYFVTSADGKTKLGGPYATRLEAIKRLQQVEYFKGKSKEEGGT